MKITAKTNKKAVRKMMVKATKKLTDRARIEDPIRKSEQEQIKQRAIRSMAIMGFVSKSDPQSEIFEYIRRRKNGKTIKVGVIIGVKEGKAVKIGWSKCNVKVGDKFDPDFGVKMAKDRAISANVGQPAPLCIQKQIRQFGARCARYFKGAKTIEMPV